MHYRIASVSSEGGWAGNLNNDTELGSANVAGLQQQVSPRLAGRDKSPQNSFVYGGTPLASNMHNAQWGAHS